jgi:hypothetical protein
MDEDYVMFCTEMSSKVQWLRKYIGNKGSDEWTVMETRGAHSELAL